MRVAIAQATPAVLDLDRSVATAIDWIRRAGREGVELLAFGECFLGGYPVWVDWPGWSDFRSDANAALYTRMRSAALVRGSEHERAIAAACADAGVAIILGANEQTEAGRSIWNSLLFFDRDGTLVNTRRKLVPTHGERLAWAPAPDRAAAGLVGATLAGATVGGLICWEHWMPMARQALHRAGEVVHVAAWPHGSDLHQLASRHYAFEGSCFVLLTALITRPTDLPDLGIPIPDDFAGLDGGSAIIAPDTSYVVAPVAAEERLLVAEIDPQASERAAFYLDTGGHYDRPALLGSPDP